MCGGRVNAVDPAESRACVAMVTLSAIWHSLVVTSSGDFAFSSVFVQSVLYFKAPSSYLSVWSSRGRKLFRWLKLHHVGVPHRGVCWQCILRIE